MNHPYFKKLTEINKEKIQDNLKNKFKLYEYQKMEYKKIIKTSIIINDYFKQFVIYILCI